MKNNGYIMTCQIGPFSTSFCVIDMDFVIQEYSIFRLLIGYFKIEVSSRSLRFSRKHFFDTLELWRVDTTIYHVSVNLRTPFLAAPQFSTFKPQSIFLVVVVVYCCFVVHFQLRVKLGFDKPLLSIFISFRSTNKWIID